MSNGGVLAGQEIDKTLDLGYIRVVGLHRGYKPAVPFNPPNFRPRTMTHVHMFVRTCVHTYIYVCTYGTFHKKLDDERRSNGRSINGRTVADVRRTDDRPIIITREFTELIKYILINTIYVYDLTSCIV